MTDAIAELIKQRNDAIFARDEAYEDARRDADQRDAALARLGAIAALADQWEQAKVEDAGWCADCGKAIVRCQPYELYLGARELQHHVHADGLQRWCDGSSSRHAHPREWPLSDALDGLRARLADSTGAVAKHEQDVRPPADGWREGDAVVVRYDDGGPHPIGTWTRYRAHWGTHGINLPVSREGEAVDKFFDEGRVLYVHAPRADALTEGQAE
jgi:hypothetical protein